jgi:hypothetical protein
VKVNMAARISPSTTPADVASLGHGITTKDDIELDHIETPKGAFARRGDDAAAAIGQKATGYESLSPLETVRTFKMATLYSVLATFAAACDGYQVRARCTMNRG